MKLPHNSKSILCLPFTRMFGTVMLASILVVGCTLLAPEPYVFHGISFQNPVTAPDFSLVDQNYQTVALRDLRGKIVLLFFGFTNCPDACPATLGTWSKVHDLLGEKAEHVRFIMITVDPERDSPEHLAKHLSMFNPEFIGLRGSIEELEHLAQEYNVYFEKVDVDSASGYLVNHTTLTYVVDLHGDLVLAHRSYEIRPHELAEDLEYLLKDHS